MVPKIFLVVLFFFLFSTSQALAESSYVLPYPSALPGNPFYKASEIKDLLLEFWYFGDFGKFSYNLKQADKYLVEAKTLFDYRQYLLGYDALKKSDSYYAKVFPALQSASTRKKNISDKLIIRAEASQKHIEELGKMKNMVPEFFDWVPEKQKPQELKLWEAIALSTSIRRN